MRYIKQKETRFDAHGHWNTVHEVELTLNDAYRLLDVLKSVPDMGDILKVLYSIIDKEP